MAVRGEALIVAHGSPSAPDAPERQLADLGALVQAQLPGWRIATATLGARGSLERALGVVERPLVYPFFMSEGWFTNTHLPARLAALGRGDLHHLAPFGTDRRLVPLIAERAIAAATEQDIAPGEMSLLIAAHGSRTSPDSARSAEELVAALHSRRVFAGVRAAFIEEAPFLSGSGPHPAKSLCLPFFALTAGHVTDDVPQSLAQSGFGGRILPPIGADPGAADLIAATIGDAAELASAGRLAAG